MKQVLIADDHEVAIRGIRSILTEVFDGVEIFEAANGQSLLNQIKYLKCDFFLLDVIMPDTDIVQLIRAIRNSNPKVPILMITASSEIGYVLETLKAGANGLVHKSRDAQEFIKAVETVISGKPYLHPETALEVARSVGPNRSKRCHDLLSDRELDIFRRIARGRSVKEIAHDLGLSDKTVATYVARIRQKTGLTTFVEMARYALQNNVEIEPSS